MNNCARHQRNRRRWYVAILIAFLTGSVSLPVAVGQPIAAAPSAEWIRNAYIHSHHSGGGYGPEWDEQIKAVRPDVMQYHANVHEAAEALARQYGFHLCLTINRSGEYDFGARNYSEAKGYFPRIDPEGRPYGRLKMDKFVRHLCFNSPAVDETLIPMYVAATERYHPSQIWIDSTVITVNYCYCSACRQAFAEEYELQSPVAPADRNWPEWIEFHRKSSERWMARLSAAVAEADPNTIVTFNHAYWPNQPEIPPPFIKNLSADIHSHSLWMGMYGRYATTVGLPFDIMNGLTDTWAGAKPKELGGLLEEIASIISTGGSWNIGEFPASPDVQPAEAMQELAVAGAEFARERKPWTFHTESVPQVAVLNSASTHYARVPPTAGKASAQQGERELYTDDGAIVRVPVEPNDSRVYWFGGEFAQPDLVGAYEALVEDQIHFDIVNEDVLARRIAEYELIVLPEQFALSPATVEAIRKYVAGGGRVLATGSTVESGLADVLGIKQATGHRADSREFGPKRNAFTEQIVYDMEPSTAQVIALETAGENLASVTMNQWQDGVAAYLNTDAFAFYSKHSPYNIYRQNVNPPEGAAIFLAVLDEVIDRILPDRLLELSAPAWFEVGLRRTDDTLLVQLLNRSWAYHGASESHGPIVVDLRMPKRPGEVVLQPGANVVDWKWDQGRLVVQLSSEQVPVHRILEVKAAK